MFSKPRRAYRHSRAASVGKTKLFLFTLIFTIKKSIKRQKTFGPNFWSQGNVHLVGLTAATIMETLCVASTAATIPMAEKARKEYHSGRTVNGGWTKLLFVHCKPYHMDLNWMQNIRLDFFRKKFGR